MRTLGEIPHPEMKISLFSWNQKYLVKLERGPLEQTYKISHLDIGSEAELKGLLTEAFINRCLERFKEMESEIALWLS